jgi:DNA-binding IclR family transcriptional regulator
MSEPRKTRETAREKAARSALDGYSDASASALRERGSTGIGADGRRRAYAALQGVGRAMEVLEFVAQRPMRASEIAEGLSLKWTTAYRSLTYLLENRYLRRDEATGIYSIGPRLYSLGQAYLMNHPLRDAGGAALRALAYETGASAQLNEREGFQATVLMAVDPKLEMIPKTTPEYHFPLHTGAKGLTLLAFSEPAVFEGMIREPLPALTENSITDPAVLRDALARIRTQGYAATREDVQIGTGSVAAPVFQADGELAGAVCVIVRAEELNDNERMAALVGAAAGTAREISIRLGWRYGDQPAAVAAWAIRDGELR